MKSFNKILAIGLLGLTVGPLFGMKAPRGQSQTAKQLHSKNAATTKANKANYQNQPFFTLNVMQPTPGYFSLNRCVNYLLKGKKFPQGYNKTPDQYWHISTIVIAVPFKGQPNKQEVLKAMADLGKIIKGYKKSLKRVSYEFKSLESIGTHKFIAAHYGFKKGRTPFLASYAQIIAKFLQKHPNSWMFFGYKTIPHISVASTGNPGGKVKISTKGCKPPKGKNKAVADVKLLHAGRKLFISAGYHDPTTQKMTFLKSKPL